MGDMSIPPEVSIALQEIGFNRSQVAATDKVANQRVSLGWAIAVVALGGGAVTDTPLVTAFAPILLLILLMMAGHDWTVVLVRWWRIRTLEAHVNSIYATSLTLGLTGEGSLQHRYLTHLSTWKLVTIGQFAGVLIVIAMALLSIYEADLLYHLILAVVVYSLMVALTVRIWRHNLALSRVEEWEALSNNPIGRRQAVQTFGKPQR